MNETSPLPVTIPSWDRQVPVDRAGARGSKRRRETVGDVQVPVFGPSFAVFMGGAGQIGGS